MTPADNLRHRRQYLKNSIAHKAMALEKIDQEKADLEFQVKEYAAEYAELGFAIVAIEGTGAPLDLSNASGDQ